MCVVTRGRTSRQITIERLPEEYRKQTYIFCHPGEKAAHEANWGDKIAGVIEYGENVTYLGAARQYIMEYCRDHGYKWCLQMDDDFVLEVKTNPETKKYEFTKENKYHIADAELLDAAWSKIRTLQEKNYGMIGIPGRFMSNQLEDEFEESCKLYSFLITNVDLYFKCGINYDNEDVYPEDFHAVCSFLERGINVAKFNGMHHNAGAEGAAGGCQEYRNLDYINKRVEGFLKTHPDCTSYVLKDTKSSDDHFGGKIMNVRVQWKKLYKLGLERSKQLTMF